MRKRSRVLLLGAFAGALLVSSTLSWAQAAPDDAGPSPVGEPARTGEWAAVAVGTYHSCGISLSGTLWCWGANKSGELGIGNDRTPRSTPVQVGIRTDWVTVMAGHNTGCAIPTDGTLWCWGRGDRGQLGDGHTDIVRVPEQIGDATNWSAISGSSGGPFYWNDSHTCGLHSDGTAWCWGENTSGQVGDGTTRNRRTPTQVGTATTWTTISAGDHRSCGTQSDGSLWCWGTGDLGNGADEVALQPVRIGSDSNWVAVSAGATHTCGRRTDGTLWCWGSNERGGLGDGTTTERLSPVQVGTRAGWVSVTAGASATCAARANGVAWCWGTNSHGLLGDGTVKWRPSPVKVVQGAGHWGDNVATRFAHSCGVGVDHSLWCWGYNEFGEVGSGTGAKSVLLPEQVELP